LNINIFAIIKFRKNIVFHPFTITYYTKGMKNKKFSKLLLFSAISRFPVMGQRYFPGYFHFLSNFAYQENSINHHQYAI